MEDLPKHKNFLNRNGHYYFRVKVPKDLLTELGKKEIKKSLGTKNPAEVKTKLALETLKAEELFSATRRKLAELSASIQRQQQATETPPLQISKADIERIVQLWHIEQEAVTSKEDDLLRASQEDVSNIKDNLIDDYRHFSSNREENNAADVQSETSQILEKNGIAVKDLPLELQNYANLIVKQSLIERTSSSLLRFGYKLERTPFQLFNPALLQPLVMQANGQVAPTKLHLLDKTIENFYAAKRSEDVTEKSLTSYKLTFDLMEELFGNDKPMQDITPADCRAFKEKLVQLPSNAKKKYPHLTLMEAIEQCAIDKLGALSTTSVNNHLKNLSAFFNFAVRERLISFNPASHTAPVKEKRGEAEKKRATFTDVEIQSLFSASIFDRQNAAKVNEGSKYWVPFVGLYTGMRLNEICQLFTSDIEHKEGTHVIQVRIDKEGRKTVKTANSIRTIPIHKQLIKLGFLDYVQSIKAKDSITLFPDLTISAKGSPSDNYSKWFHRTLKALNLKRPKLCFHSFRHRFRDQCRAHDINREISGALGGWAHSDDVMDGYGEGYSLDRLQAEINKINNIDLQSHSHPS